MWVTCAAGLATRVNLSTHYAKGTCRRALLVKLEGRFLLQPFRFKVLFIISLTVLFAVAHNGAVQLGRRSSLLSTEKLVLRCTRPCQAGLAVCLRISLTTLGNPHDQRAPTLGQDTKVDKNVRSPLLVFTRLIWNTLLRCFSWRYRWGSSDSKVDLVRRSPSSTPQKWET